MERGRTRSAARPCAAFSNSPYEPINPPFRGMRAAGTGYRVRFMTGASVQTTWAGAQRDRTLTFHAQSTPKPSRRGGSRDPLESQVPVRGLELPRPCGQRILRTRPTATRDHACLFVVADPGSRGDHVRAGRRRIASVRGHVQGHGVAPPPPPRLGARRAAVRLTAAPGRRETSPTSQSPVPRRRVAG